MLTFNFDQNNFNSTDGTVKATSNGTKITAEYDGKKGVASFSGSNYLSFTETKLSYSDQNYCIKITFSIDKAATTDMLLLSGSSIPIEISLKKASNNTFYVYSQVVVGSNVRSAVSKEVLSKGTWYTLEFVLLDGQFYVTINGKAFCRRVFRSTPAEVGIVGRKMLFIGGTNTNSKSFFKGYIDEIVFSEKVSTKQKNTATELADIGYMEADSKQQDLTYDGRNTGKLISEGLKVYSDDVDSHCYYNVYEYGIIFWSPVYKAVFMSKKIFDEYILRVNKKAYIGLPYDDEIMVSQGNSYCKFDAGALFDIKGVNTITYLPPDMFAEFERDRLVYQFPVSGFVVVSVSNKNGSFEMEYVKFPDYTMFRFQSVNNDYYILRLENILAEKYISSFDSYGPLEKYYEGYTYKTRNNMGKQRTEKYFYWRCRFKTVCLKYVDSNTMPTFIKMDNDVFDFFVENNGTNKSENCGDYKFPKSDPKKSKKGTEYQNFKGGVIFRKNGKLHGYTQLKLYLVHITSNHIDDGVNDRNAELYIEVFLGLNEEYNIVDGRRWPDYSERKHGGTEFDITYKNSKENVCYNFPQSVTGSSTGIQGEDIIYFHVKVHDWDKWTGNEYLGSYTFEFNIDTGWGILEDAIESGKIGYDSALTGKKATYSGVYMTHQGKDNRNGLSNIKLTFRIEDTTEPVNIDDYFRKYAYWSIDNFKALDKVSRSRYDALFGVQTGKWYDWILAFWDSVWFKVVNDDDNGYWGKKGLCFGMSVAALESIHGYGNYSLPLCDWNPDKNGSQRTNHDYSDEVKPEYYHLFQDKHMYQAGWDHIMHSIDKAIKGEMLISSTAFNDIKRQLDKGYCLVNLFGDGGHTVLAYKYDNDKIYVADSNHPWYQSDSGDYTDRPDAVALAKIKRDTSYIKLSSDVVKEIELHYATTSNSDVLAKKYRYCYATPYSIVSHRPHVPSWGEVIFDTLSSIVRIGEFCINNFFDFLFMITFGDAQPTGFEGHETQLRIVDIPYLDAQDPRAFTNDGIHIMFGIVKNDAKIKIRGNGKGKYRQFIIGKNKFYSIEASTTENETDTISLSKLLSSEPKIEVQSDNAKKNFKIEKQVAVVHYGANATERESSLGRFSNQTKKLKYYINTRAQRNGDHEMHCEYCSALPMSKNMIYLGEFESETAALKAAKKIYSKADGCSKCCPATNKDGK